MTKEEAISHIMERIAANEEAATALVDALMEYPDTVATNPPIAMALIRLLSVRTETGRILDECRKVLEDDGD